MFFKLIRIIDSVLIIQALVRYSLLPLLVYQFSTGGFLEIVLQVRIYGVLTPLPPQRRFQKFVSAQRLLLVHIVRLYERVSICLIPLTQNCLAQNMLLQTLLVFDSLNFYYCYPIMQINLKNIGSKMKESIVRK